MKGFSVLCKIKCQWMNDQRILVNPDGQVLPCCYLANVMYLYDLKDDPKEYIKKSDVPASDELVNSDLVAYETGQQPVLREYHNNRKKHNIFETELSEIVESEWFTKTLPESWEDENRLIPQCKKYCSEM